MSDKPNITDITELKDWLEEYYESNSPEYRGAPTPKFDPLKINPTEFADEMRPKYYRIPSHGEQLKNGEPELYIDFQWITQEPFNKEMAQGFFKEFIRWLQYVTAYIEDKVNIAIQDPINIYLEVEARDGPSRGHETAMWTLDNSKDEFIESVDKTKVYFGFKGGEGGDYFDADYFELIPQDGGYAWEEAGGSYSSEGKTFKTKRAAIDDAVKTMTPDDGTKIITGSDPDKLYDKIMKKDVQYWIQYGNSEKDSQKTDMLTEGDVIGMLEKYQDEYLYVKVHSTDNDYSANYNF